LTYPCECLEGKDQYMGTLKITLADEKMILPLQPKKKKKKKKRNNLIKKKAESFSLKTK